MGVDVYPRPETAQGIFINFKNVAQIARRKPPFGIAQIGKAFRNEITPGNFILRTLEFEQMEMEYCAAGRGGRVVPLLGRRAARVARPLLRARKSPPRPPARRRRALPLLERDERHRVPLPDGLVGARVANRGAFDLTQHSDASGAKLEWVDAGTGYASSPT